jgi:hypothetical protein
LRNFTDKESRIKLIHFFRRPYTWHKSFFNLSFTKHIKGIQGYLTSLKSSAFTYGWLILPWRLPDYSKDKSKVII